MRTTLTLDDDLAARLRELARQRGVSFKEVVNATLRAGLGPPGDRGRQPYVQKTYNLGLRPGVNLDKALRLAGELEDEEIIRKLALRK